MTKHTKYIWEEKDVHAGLRVKDETEEQWLIGYDPSRTLNLFFVSLYDGMLYTSGNSVKGMTKFLNSGFFEPVK